VALGGQDCHAAAAGAHTGDVSAEMLADLGCSAVIVGHSERRADHGEDDPVVRDKAAAAHRAGLTAIICIGETLAERDGGATYGVLATQLYGSLPKGATAANTVIAYEPVWAIGTGRTATLEQIADAHDHIRTVAGATAGAPDADALRILYGGSVNPDNAADILATAGVDGALVGGASLDAAKFWAIVTAANAAET
jgi:triosephosphate isomerase